MTDSLGRPEDFCSFWATLKGISLSELLMLWGRDTVWKTSCEQSKIMRENALLPSAENTVCLKRGIGWLGANKAILVVSCSR